MFSVAEPSLRIERSSGEEKRSGGVRVRCLADNLERELAPDRIFLLGFAVTH
jgi:hypothetical protein